MPLVNSVVERCSDKQESHLPNSTRANESPRWRRSRRGSHRTSNRGINFALGCLTQNVFCRDQLRNLDVNLCPLAFFAANIHLKLIAIQQTQALMHVADADAAIRSQQAARAKC